MTNKPLVRQSFIQVQVTEREKNKKKKEKFSTFLSHAALQRGISTKLCMK